MGDIPIKRTESYSGLCIGGPLDGQVLENRSRRVTIPVRDGWGKDPHGVDIPVYGAFDYEWREYGAIKVWMSPKGPAPAIDNTTLQAEIKSLEKAHDVTLEAFEIAKHQVESLTKVINDVRRELKSHNYPFDVVGRPLAHAVDAAIDRERILAHEQRVKLLGRFVEKILQPKASMLPASEIRPDMIEQTMMVCFNAIDHMRGQLDDAVTGQSTRAETLHRIGVAIGVRGPLYEGELNNHLDRIESVIIDRIRAIQDVNEKTFAGVRAPLEEEVKTLHTVLRRIRETADDACD